MVAIKIQTLNLQKQLHYQHYKPKTARIINIIIIKTKKKLA